jgi:23S rRNA (guanosine2251-2'-O)-methyltransferase
MAPAGIGNKVEGIHAATAALAAGRVRVLYIEKGRRDLDELTGLAESAGAAVQLVDDARDKAVTDRPQGVVAECEPIRPVALDSLCVDKAMIMVLDHLTDPRNVGAVARSALAFGATGLVVANRRSAPLGPLAFKAAAGAFESLPVVVVSSIGETIERLKTNRVWTVGLDAGGEVDIADVTVLDESVALVLGEEGTGLSRLVRERVDVVASIPMQGESESLNASVAAAVALYVTSRTR